MESVLKHILRVYNTYYELIETLAGYLIGGRGIIHTSNYIYLFKSPDVGPTKIAVDVDVSQLQGGVLVKVFN